MKRNSHQLQQQYRSEHLGFSSFLVRLMSISVVVDLLVPQVGPVLDGEGKKPPEERVSNTVS